MNKKLLIGMYAHGLPFNGHTLKDKSLGGSETALLYMAKALAARGHDVKVFNNCDKPGRYDGVDYFDFTESWRDIAPITEWDVFITSRNFTFLSQKFNSKLNILWNHDILSDRGVMMTNVWNCDAMFCLSDFHIDQFLSVAKELKPIISKTRNGVDLELIDHVKAKTKYVPRVPHMFVWGSRPERGLDTLLQKTWPRILKEVDKKAVLMIAGYSDAGLQLPEDIKAYHRFIDNLIDTTPGVTRVGALNKTQWYELLCTAGQMIYPTSFPEISCINAMEAQACGLPIVTSNNFALVETVKDKQNLINGNPKSDEYQSSFIARVKRLFTNDFEYKKSQKLGRDHIEGKYEWSTIAAEWEDFIWDMFEKRSLTNGGRNVLKNLMYKSDMLASKWVLDHPEETGVSLTECTSIQAELDKFLVGHHEDPEQYQRPDDTGEVPFNDVPRFGIACSHLKKHFKKEPFTIVDVGCGSGGFLARVLKEFPNQAQVLGIDFSQQLIDRAGKFINKYYPSTGDPSNFLVKGDFMEMLVPDKEPADAIFAGEWLEHQVDVYGALNKLEEWVREGGSATITIPSGPWEAMSFKEQPDVRFHVSHFEFRDIEEIFLKKKFEMQFVPMGVSSIDGSLVGNWVITWLVDKLPFGKIDYLRKFRTMRPYQFISACMIVKNEEDNIVKCLKSIYKQVDEIIVYDTGSTDETIRLAEKYATKVIRGTWDDDFSDARNASIAEANSEADWIYWMDADEVLVGAEKLKKYLNSSVYNGYVITQNHLILDMEGVKPDVPVRIYKNNLGIKFFGTIHEHCELALDIPIAPILILPDVKIVHYGYLTENVRRWKAKERNLELLMKDRKKYPTRQLGIVLMMRDYLNMSQWELDLTHGQVTEQVYTWLREVIKLHRNHFTDEKHLYNELSTSLYQRALIFLGTNGLSVIEGTEEYVPFEVIFAMGGSPGGMREPERVMRSSFWFADRDEFETWLRKKGIQLMEALKLPYLK